MRRTALFLLAQIAVAAPLAAQQFEGTVNMKIMGGPQGQMDMKMVTKGDMQATIMTMPAAAGPMAGMEMRMVYDPKTATATTLMPIPAAMSQMPAFANAKGIKTVIDLSKMAVGTGGAADETIDIKKLATTEKVAGIDCTDYEITSSKGQTMRACIAQSLGHFLFPQISSPMSGRGGGAPAWTKAFGTNPGFPLKVWSADGQVAMEVTSIERGTISASMFEIPQDYVDMSAMFRGRGGH
jgi:hypothetical protein